MIGMNQKVLVTSRNSLKAKPSILS